MTNDEFIAALRRAKPVAVNRWRNDWCIWDALRDEKIFLGDCRNAIFGDKRRGEYLKFMKTVKSPADIARVFDESIKALEGKK